MTEDIEDYTSNVLKSYDDRTKAQKPYPTAWKIKELEEHVSKIKSVEISESLWGRWWTINFAKESLSLRDKQMLTATAYRRAYFGRFQEIPPMMMGETWKLFVNMLKSKIMRGIM